LLNFPVSGRSGFNGEGGSLRAQDPVDIDSLGSHLVRVASHAIVLLPAFADQLLGAHEGDDVGVASDGWRRELAPLLKFLSEAQELFGDHLMMADNLGDGAELERLRLPAKDRFQPTDVLQHRRDPRLVGGIGEVSQFRHETGTDAFADGWMLNRLDDCRIDGDQVTQPTLQLQIRQLGTERLHAWKGYRRGSDLGQNFGAGTGIGKPEPPKDVPLLHARDFGGPFQTVTARQGRLSGEGLSTAVDRLLSDDKINRFIDDFPRQWLQLHRLGMFPPDGKLYPDYDVWLEASMREEVVHYFREVFTNDRAIDAFITSDWTMANPRLCEFYGLPEPKTSGFQLVSLQPDHHRGGLLTMGAILGLTSDGTRHRPVHRGVWISEAIFGKTPPPPPANVDPIEPNPPDSPKATIRQKLEAHTQNANCAACHRSIDPLGLAFDQFDAIGQWRTHEHVEKGTGSNPPVNPTGKLPDGRAFSDAEQFKRLLRDDREHFLRAFVEHLSTYALRRVLTVDDREDIRSIVDEAKKRQYGSKDIVRAVALSDLIRKR
jgi:hypothetical protein